MLFLIVSFNKYVVWNIGNCFYPIWIVKVTFNTINVNLTSLGLSKPEIISINVVLPTPLFP